MNIRPAKKEDCFIMSQMINKNAVKDLMLPKNSEQLIELIDNFFVAEEEHNVIGCCGFKLWKNRDSWVEIISLTVKARYEGQGIGTQLVQSCLVKAQSQGFKKFFTLTLRPNLFERLGFRQVDILTLPHKVFGECVYCPKNAAGPGDVDCNEVALVLTEKSY